MPTTAPGRELVKNFIDNSEFTAVDLSKIYGLSKQDVTNYINGSKTGKKANNFILTVIHDFKI